MWRAVCFAQRRCDYRQIRAAPTPRPMDQKATEVHEAVCRQVSYLRSPPVSSCRLLARVLVSAACGAPGHCIPSGSENRLREQSDHVIRALSEKSDFSRDMSVVSLDRNRRRFVVYDPLALTPW